MKLERAFLQSKVARRIFVLFILCALLPIGALAFVAFTRVTQQLDEQSRERLQKLSKNVALGIYERLLFLEGELRIVAANLTNGQIGQAESITGQDLKQRFQRMVLMDKTGRVQHFSRSMELPPKPTEEEMVHLENGNALLSTVLRQNREPQIFMSIGSKSPRSNESILVGEINQDYLWSMDTVLPGGTELTILDDSNRLLASSLPGIPSFSEQVMDRLTYSAIGQFDWKQGDETYLASFWSLPLKFKFSIPRWSVILSQSKVSVMAPLTNFKKTFPMIILMSLGVVSLLSIGQIRRSLIPLERLRQGTRRIAQKQFDSRVTLQSRDEFEELAHSFNAMASQLGRQFQALATIGEIDRAILSSLDTDKILETVLTRMREVFPCDHVSVAVLDPVTDTTRIYRRHGNSQGKTEIEHTQVKAEELLSLRNHPQGVWIDEQQIPPALAPLLNNGKSSLVLPIFIGERISGIIALGYLQPPPHNQDDLDQARQLADQVAVAIQNSNLFEETRKQAAELAKANRVKDEFMSVMSHELRTPLTVLMGYAEMIQQGLMGEINPEQDKALGVVRARGMDLLAIIDGIMEAVKIEAGAAQVESHQVKLKELLDELQSTHKVPAGKKLVLSWDYPPVLPGVQVDRGKLKYVLQQLINNALKFTDKGQVKVSVQYLKSEDSVIFKVADTGVGIPKKALPNIFEKFHQVDSSGKRSYEGVGLGLFIVEKFTYLMGGKINVESEPGVGSTFTLTIPVTAWKAPTAEAHTTLPASDA